MWVFA